MGIFELFEIGLFTALWNWKNPILTIIVYTCVFVGVLIQMIIDRKYKGSIKQWSFLIVCLVGTVISECLWHMITGWDRLGVDIAYGAIICMMLGSLVLEAVCKIRKV